MASHTIANTAVALLILQATTANAAPCRDRFAWPFADTSIWNSAIGSGAAYLPANIYSTELPTQIHNDQEWLVRTTSTDPLTPWVDDSGAFPGGCKATGAVRSRIPFPRNLTTDCVDNNNSGAILLPDNRTLVQLQPLYRPTAGGPIIAWYHTGAPQPFPWAVDVLGDGALGSHGGSGLSGMGGAIRLGELTNGSQPITHALKLELWAHSYYFYNYTSAFYDSCYTWPATGCDSYYNSASGNGYNGSNPHLVPGALLAVPPGDAPAVAAQLTTLPGKQMLRALVDYGGYIVDDTGSQAGGGAFCAESGVNAEVAAAFGYSIAIEKPLNVLQGAPLYFDLVAIFRALSIVTNNGWGSVGGGGVPRRPPPPPTCE